MEESDILSQDDIDSLLTQAVEDGPASSQTSSVILADGTRRGSDEAIRIEPYDFRNPAFLGETQMRRLRLLHEEFIRLLEARMSLFLRTEITMTMSKLDTLSYEQAIQSIENPTHLALFRASPLPGIGFMEISPRLALTVTSSIMGGKGQAPKNDRYLTRIETDLIEEFLFILLQGWCSQWQYESHLEPTIVGHEVVGSVLQLCDEDTVMLSLTMEINLRGCSGRLQIAVPLFMIEPLVRHLQAKRDEEGEQGKVRNRSLWRRRYEKIVVPIDVKTKLAVMTVRDVSQMQPGDILPLPEGALEKAIFRLAKIPVFEGEIGVEGEQRAFCVRGKVNL